MNYGHLNDTTWHVKNGGIRMSRIAPWLALSIDWQESEMFDGTSHEVQLAWIHLLCFAKSQGRAGRVRFRAKKFAEAHRLSIDAVDELLARASNAEAIIIGENELTLTNWSVYQDPRVRNRGSSKLKVPKELTPKRRQISKTSKKDVTHHPSPITHHPPPPPPVNEPAAAGWEAVEKDLFELGVAEASQAVAEAQRNGSTPESVRSLIAHWQSHPGRWGLGALRKRIGIDRLQMKADLCWVNVPGEIRSALAKSEYRQVDLHIFQTHARNGDFSRVRIRIRRVPTARVAYGARLEAAARSKAKQSPKMDYAGQHTLPIDARRSANADGSPRPPTAAHGAKDAWTEIRIEVRECSRSRVDERN